MKQQRWQMICGCLVVIACALLIGTVFGAEGGAEADTGWSDDDLIFDLAERKQTLEAVTDIGESLQKLQRLDDDTLRRLAKLESNQSLQRIIALLVDENELEHSAPAQIGAAQILFARPDDEAVGQQGRVVIDWRRQIFALQSGEKTATRTGYINLLGVEDVGQHKMRVKISLVTEAGNREIYFPN